MLVLIKSHTTDMLFPFSLQVLVLNLQAVLQIISTLLTNCASRIVAAFSRDKNWTVCYIRHLVKGGQIGNLISCHNVCILYVLSRDALCPVCLVSIPRLTRKNMSYVVLHGFHPKVQTRPQGSLWRPNIKARLIAFLCSSWNYCSSLFCYYIWS